MLWLWCLQKPCPQWYNTNGIVITVVIHLYLTCIVPYFPHKKKRGDSKQLLSPGHNAGLLLTSWFCSVRTPVLLFHKLLQQIKTKFHAEWRSRVHCLQQEQERFDAVMQIQFYYIDRWLLSDAFSENMHLTLFVRHGQTNETQDLLPINDFITVNLHWALIQG